MTEQTDSSEKKSKRRPVLVSSASSLDTFLMDLPGTSDLALDMNEHAAIGTVHEESEAANNTDVNNMDEETSQLYPASEVLSNSMMAANTELGSSSSVALNQLFPELGMQASALLHPSLTEDEAMMQVAAPAPTIAVSGSVPEFLYQLTKMLTDDNRDIIEWSNGRIEVHSPHKLESHVLKKYFRHSKFASFQRQLNYFGFRKLAGKGKMAPCSYVNEAAGDDIGSLLLIKRKSGPTPSAKDGTSKKQPSSPRGKGKVKKTVVNPVLAGIFNESTRGRKKNPVTTAVVSQEEKSAVPSDKSVASVAGTHQALARRAVGRGIRHSFEASTVAGQLQATQSQPASTTQSPFAAPTAAHQPSTFTLQAPASQSLSELATNYQNTLNGLGSQHEEPTPLSQMQNQSSQGGGADATFTGFLSRNSSLVDLAMLAPVDEALEMPPPSTEESTNFGFVDFPNPDVYPPKADEGNNT